MSVEALKNLLRAGGLSLDFVFVSACHSRNTGEAFADAGVPHVVCVKVDEKVVALRLVLIMRVFSLLSVRFLILRPWLSRERSTYPSSPATLFENPLT